ncbi:MAG TPA: HD domain-containing protein [Anaerolineae bacterium]|nr:HD domain-containing protein [Anaerolineae bacterium]
MSLTYRASQTFRVLLAKPGSEDLALAEEHLLPPLVELFHQMSPADQIHGLRVLHSLLAQDEGDPNLLAAALLHDVGKSQVRLRLWERILIVLVSWFAPERSQRWGEGQLNSWRRPFVIAVHHPAWGAEMIRQAGGTEELATLVLRHQETLPPDPAKEIDRLLFRLQEADGLN